MADLFWRERIYLKSLLKWSNHNYTEHQLSIFKFRRAIRTLLDNLNKPDKLSKREFEGVYKSLLTVVSLEEGRVREVYLSALQSGIEPRDTIELLFQTNWYFIPEMRALFDIVGKYLYKPKPRYEPYRIPYETMKDFLWRWENLYHILKYMENNISCL